MFAIEPVAGRRKTAWGKKCVIPRSRSVEIVLNRVTVKRESAANQIINAKSAFKIWIARVERSAKTMSVQPVQTMRPVGPEKYV